MTGSLFIQHGDPIWLSPSIWLTVPPSTQPTWTAVGEGNNNGLTGNIENIINVQVDRMGGGTDPSPVRVDSYVCVPTAAVGPGGSTLASAGGATGLSSSNDPTLPFPQVISMPWYPTGNDVTINGGHLCIGANAYDLSGSDGGQVFYPAVLDLTDQHMAQRNISIIAAPSQHSPVWLSAVFLLPQASVFVNAPDQAAVIKVEQVPVEKTLSPVVREQLLMSSRVTVTGGAAPADAAGVAHGLPGPPERMLLRGGGDLALTGTDFILKPRQQAAPPVMLQGPCGFGAEQEFPLSPRTGHAVTALFEVTPDVPGEVFEFDIVHLLTSGNAVGGLRVVVVTVPELD